MSAPRRGEIYWVNLDPTVGSEIQKKRPCVIVSNDKGNAVGQTLIVVPLTTNTSVVRSFETIVATPKKKSKAVCPQVRCVDKRRLTGKAVYRLSRDELECLESALKVALALS